MKQFVYPLLIFVLFSCLRTEPKSLTPTFIPSSSDSIRYTGRFTSTSDSVTIYWPGSSILFRFKGKSVQAVLKDELGENYFNVIIDGDSLHYFKPDTLKTRYALAKNLADGDHTIELIKRTECHKGKTWFYGLELEEGSLLALEEPNHRVIEFFGNSITAGYAIDDTSGTDSPDGPFTNNYYSYAAITARYFNADYYCTAKSGIGVMVSWFPLIMPEMFNRLDPSDSLSRWDFNKVQPDIVVINLLQNDLWLLRQPKHPMFRQRFGETAPDKISIVEAYRSFVLQIRKVYPHAHIICALGNMDIVQKDSPWPGYVKEAVDKLGDTKLHTLFFPYEKTKGHPGRKENESMAGILVAYIEKNIQW